MAQCWLMTTLPPRLTGVRPGLPWRNRNQRATNYPMKNKYMPSCTAVCLHKPPLETEKFSARKGLRCARSSFRGEPSNAPLRALDCALETTDQDVDEVVAVGRLDAVSAQSAQELRVRDRRVVRANQHSCDGSLNIHRSCGKKQARKRLQAFAIGKRVRRQRIERVNLRFGPVHSGNARGHATQLVRIGDRMMTEIDLRHPNLLVAGACQSAKHPPMPVGAPQASEYGGLRRLF